MLNVQAAGNHQASGGDPQEKSRKKNEIQREMLIQEGELKSKLNQKIIIEADIRSLKKEESEIKVRLQDNQQKLQKLESEIVQLNALLANLKKKLNLI